MFPATLFDYNGVLVDDERVHLEAFRDALAPLGLALSETDYWERYLGFDDRGAFSAIASDAGLSLTDAELEALVEAKKPHYLRRAEGNLRGFPGAADLVRRRAGVGPVVIVSGALRQEIELGLTTLGVRDAVTGVVSAEDAPRSKPDPAGFLLGIERVAAELGATRAAQSLVIEDSVSGVQAAKAAGLACVAVTHSYGRDALIAAGADAVVESLATVGDALLAGLFVKLHG